MVAGGLVGLFAIVAIGWVIPLPLGSSRLLRSGGGGAQAMVQRSAARERGRQREREKAEDSGTHPQPLQHLGRASPRRAARPAAGAVASVTLLRHNVAKILYINGSTAERHTPSFDQRRDQEEWLAVRAALEMTASEFAASVGKWRHASRQTLIDRKLGLEHAMFRGNAATDFGTATEPRAVVAYERATNASVAQTGLHMHPNLRWGASPDGIVTTADGQTGLLEVKCSYRLRNFGVVPQLEECPEEFRHQVQGQLAITGLDWCDLFYYVPPNRHSGGGRNWCRVRVARDDSFFADLTPHLDSFGADLRAARNRLDLGATVPSAAEDAATGAEPRSSADAAAAADAASDADASAAAAATALELRGLARAGSREGARRAAHDELLRLVADLIVEARGVLPADMHTEPTIASLPARYGLKPSAAADPAASSPRSLLTPDIVAADTRRRETIVAEVTIVPDGALGRYSARKRRKYATLGTQSPTEGAAHASTPTERATERPPERSAPPAEAGGGLPPPKPVPPSVEGSDSLMDSFAQWRNTVLPPLVVAVGESGALHPASAEALRAALPTVSDERMATFEAEAAAIARRRPATSSSSARRRAAAVSRRALAAASR